MRSKTIIAVALAAFMSVGYAAMPAQFSPAVSVSAVAKLTAPTGITYTSTTNSVTLKWDKVNGADAYRIYKYDTAKKKFVKYKTVTGTVCEVEGLDTNTAYKIRVASLEKVSSRYEEGGHEDIKVKTSATKKKYVSKKIPKIPDVLKTKYGFTKQVADNGSGITTIAYSAVKNGKTGSTKYADTEDLQDWYDMVIDAKKDFERQITSAGYSFELVEDNSNLVNEEELNYSYDYRYKVYYNGEHVANLRYYFSSKATDRHANEFRSYKHYTEVKMRADWKFSYNTKKFTLE
ncbi:MAG: fibronectin type III domain-containing protein [Oscillospiraceae bacterium]|nr:fibronectin type III domain-containing protein [Oscillospiraceae bacterium]